LTAVGNFVIMLAPQHLLICFRFGGANSFGWGFFTSGGGENYLQFLNPVATNLSSEFIFYMQLQIVKVSIKIGMFIA